MYFNTFGLSTLIFFDSPLLSLDSSRPSTFSRITVHFDPWSSTMARKTVPCRPCPSYLARMTVQFGSRTSTFEWTVNFRATVHLKDRPLSPPLTVHFGPDSKCSLPFISIFWTKMLRSSFETRSLLIQSFLSNIEIPVRVSHKSLTDLQATLMTDLEYFVDISWFLISQTTF